MLRLYNGCEEVTEGDVGFHIEGKTGETQGNIFMDMVGNLYMLWDPKQHMTYFLYTKYTRQHIYAYQISN